MKFLIRCGLDFHAASPATLILNIEAARTPSQLVEKEILNLSPSFISEPYVTPDSQNRLLRFMVSPNEIPNGLQVSYQSTVNLLIDSYDPTTIFEIPVQQLPLGLLTYLYPTRYCQSDRITRLAKDEFGGLNPGHGRVTAISNWIYDKIEYLRQSSDAHTSVQDTLLTRAGVCRDFAHLGIALCRALNIPARFVSGYAVGLNPPDFHAVFEAYLSGRWYLFDATRQAVLGSFVRIGVGRDAADVPFATTFGVITSARPVVSIEQLEGNAVAPTTSAVTTSSG